MVVKLRIRHKEAVLARLVHQHLPNFSASQTDLVLDRLPYLLELAICLHLSFNKDLALGSEHPESVVLQHDLAELVFIGHFSLLLSHLYVFKSECIVERNFILLKTVDVLVHVVLSRLEPMSAYGGRHVASRRPGGRLLSTNLNAKSTTRWCCPLAGHHGARIVEPTASAGVEATLAVGSVVALATKASTLEASRILGRGFELHGSRWLWHVVEATWRSSRHHGLVSSYWLLDWWSHHAAIGSWLHH